MAVKLEYYKIQGTCIEDLRAFQTSKEYPEFEWSLPTELFEERYKRFDVFLKSEIVKEWGNSFVMSEPIHPDHKKELFELLKQNKFSGYDVWHKSPTNEQFDKYFSESLSEGILIWRWCLDVKCDQRIFSPMQPPSHKIIEVENSFLVLKDYRILNGK